MKMISNFTDTTIQASDIMISQFEIQSLNNDFYTDKDQSDDQIDGMKLLTHINQQFDLLYKENKKRKYLLKEVSIYLVQK